MQKIGIENENVIRIVTDALGILASLSFLVPCWLEHGGFVPLLVASLFVLLFSLFLFAKNFFDDINFFSFHPQFSLSGVGQGHRMCRCA